MYSIKPYTKKKYITPIIEFEMMEEEGALMDDGMVTGSGPHEGYNPDSDGDLPAKRSDFIFDDDWSSGQSQSSNENNDAW